MFVCLFLCRYQQLRPSAAEPAVSLCQVKDQKTPGHTPAHIYILPAPPCSARHSPSLSVDPICVLTPCLYLLVQSVNPNLLSYHAPIFMFANFCTLVAQALWLCHLCTSFTNVDQGLHTFNTCLRFSHGSLITGKLQYGNCDNSCHNLLLCLVQYE